MSAAVIHVVGIGFKGADDLTPSQMGLLRSATLMVGGTRHLAIFKALTDSHNIRTLPLGNFTGVFEQMRSHLSTQADPRIVFLASGDPLFFGVGRLLLSNFRTEQLAFYPHVSAVQIAFSRLKLPWQNATLLSLHGRSETLLEKALKRGDELIAVLTDGVLTPNAIASFITSLDLPAYYRLWVCENLDSCEERIGQYRLDELATASIAFAPLNVVILQRQSEEARYDSPLPLVGLPDSAFKGFCDRPSLITKKEIRLLILGELAPLDGQVFWDIGAGTGSVSIEISRLCPQAQIYAIEKSAAGVALIRHNAERLAIAPINALQGKAPDALQTLPSPDRVFIGGSSGELVAILEHLFKRQTLKKVVLALATLENLVTAIDWIERWIEQRAVSAQWSYRLTQANISRSAPVGPLTRFSPLTPVTLITLSAKR